MESAARKQFLRDYAAIRHAEGRGSNDGAYYKALPFRDLSGRNSAMWRMRAKTFRYFENEILKPIEPAFGRPLRILDLGAGNCWLSYRLALRKHQLTAVDIFTDELDGLNAAPLYGLDFTRIEADFDCLPVDSSSFDLAIYNSSFHYSTDYRSTLEEAKRVLSPGGLVVVLDSPLYRHKRDGMRMVEERHSDFQRRYGFRSDAIPSIEFLDSATLLELGTSLSLEWTAFRPWYGWRWHLRPLRAALKRQRPPSRFFIFTGRFRRS